MLIQSYFRNPRLDAIYGELNAISGLVEQDSLGSVKVAMDEPRRGAMASWVNPVLDVRGEGLGIAVDNRFEQLARHLVNIIDTGTARFATRALAVV
jgi:hypothetical protein